MWQNTLTGVLGLVVLVLAFMGLTGSALMWTLVILGVVIAFVGFTGSVTTPTFGRDTERRHSLR